VVLFKLDPAPYQFVVDQKKAALAEAEQGMKQLKSSLDQASARLQKAALPIGVVSGKLRSEISTVLSQRHCQSCS
jgi:multidrug resistance efflux pump